MVTSAPPTLSHSKLLKHLKAAQRQNCSLIAEMRRRFAHAWLIACASAAKPTTLQVATYNVLNPVHKSVGNNREADDDALWLARGRRQAAFVADALGGADVICLQEWFFEPRWSQLFEDALPSYRLCTARRRGVHPHASRWLRRKPERTTGSCCEAASSTPRGGSAGAGSTWSYEEPVQPTWGCLLANRCRARSTLRLIQGAGYGSGPAQARGRACAQTRGSCFWI